MAALTPLEAAILLFSLVQLLLVRVIGQDGRWRRPLVLATIALFVLNGSLGLVVTLGRLVGGWSAEEVAPRLSAIFDLPTNFLLIVVGLLALAPRHAQEVRWPHRLVAAALVAFAIVNAAFRLTVSADWTPPPAQLFFLQEAPVALGFSLLLIAFMLRLRESERPEDASRNGLLLVGWGARPAQFALTSASFVVQGQSLDSMGPYRGATIAAYLVLFSTWLVVQAWATAWALRQRRSGVESAAWIPGALGTAALLGLALSFFATSDAYLPAQLVTLIVIRPLVVASAYDALGSVRVTLRVLAWSFIIIGAKWIFAATTGQPALGLGPWDVIAIPVGLLLAYVADRALAPFYRLVGRAGTAALRGGFRSNEEKILRALLDHARAPEPVTAATLSNRTGISVSNVHREIDRLRRRLVEAGPAGTTGPELIQRITPRRGHGFEIRLTPLGADLATKHLSKLERPNRAPEYGN